MDSKQPEVVDSIFNRIRVASGEIQENLEAVRGLTSLGLDDKLATEPPERFVLVSMATEMLASHNALNALVAFQEFFIAGYINLAKGAGVPPIVKYGGERFASYHEAAASMHAEITDELVNALVPFDNDHPFPSLEQLIAVISVPSDAFRRWAEKYRNLEFGDMLLRLQMEMMQTMLVAEYLPDPDIEFAAWNAVSDDGDTAPAEDVLVAPVNRRHMAPPCPKCKGPMRVVSTRGNMQYVHCRNKADCGYTGKSKRLPKAGG